MGSYGWDERELVRRCKEGSEAAYAELVRQHRQRLVNLAYRLTGNRETAEDVVQETFVAAFRAMERFEPRPAVAPWLNTIAVRLAGRASRRAGTGAASLDRILDPGGDDAAHALEFSSLTAAFGTRDATTDPAAAAESAELRRELSAGIADLPFKHRAAVVLRFVVGLEYAEAALAMDVPLNTYKSLLLRGTRQLREHLGDRLAPPGGEARIEVQVAGQPDGHWPDLAADALDGRDAVRSVPTGRPGARTTPTSGEAIAPVVTPVERRAFDRSSGATPAILAEEPSQR